MTEGAVRITQAQIYEELQGVKEVQAQTNALLEKHIALQEEQNKTVNATVNDLIGKRAADRADIDRHEIDITLLKTAEAARKERRTPWWVWITAGGGIIAGGGGLVSVWLMLEKIATAYQQVNP